MKLPIYMDHHATTPVDPRVLDEMLPYLREKFGNAASKSHSFGWEAEEAIEIARARTASLIGADPREIIFTSGATESNNLALFGVAEMYRDLGRHIVTGATEHRAVLDPVRRLVELGCEATFLPVDRYGRVDAASIARAIRKDTILVSLMFANNEVGTIHPIAEIGKIAKERKVLFHTDAAQAVGKLAIDVEAMGIDLLSLSAHKMYGPKGIGALYVRRRNPRVRLAPVLHGGGHERGLRSGTPNVPAIVGLGAASALAAESMDAESARVGDLRDRLESRIQAGLEEVTRNGHPEHRLPGNSNLSFAHVEGESLMMSLEGVAVSSGSACTSATVEPSHVLRAMGVSEELARASIRFGLGRGTTAEEVDYVADLVVRNCRKLREMSPLYEAVRAGREGTGTREEPDRVS